MAKNSTAHKVNSYCTLAISTAHFVSENTILGPGSRSSKVIQGHRLWYQLKACMRLPISV